MDSGSNIVRSLPELHSSDDLSSDDESDFETEPLETSSSSSDDSESVSELLHPRQRHKSRCRTPSSSDESEVSKEVPDWFLNKAFLYNGRISILAIPGMLLVLLFSGDTLLLLMTIGSLAVYLLYNAGNKQKALFAYLASFVAIQITVVYSVVPLLWKSVLNLVVILSLNVYTFMTGGWILLLFEDFRFHDVELLILIEAGLFSLYPGVFIILVTWSVAVMTTVAMAPYVLMLVGFVILQVFLSPTTSSFVKSHPQGSIAVWDLPSGYILDPNAVAVIALMYAAAPPFLVIAIRLTTSWCCLFSMLTLVQVLFVASISVFLATFLNLRPFLDSRGIEQKQLLILRWSSSFVAMALLIPFMICLEIRLSVLPWLPLILALYISIIICYLQRHKAAVRASLLMLLLGFFLIFCQLPSTLNYNVSNGSISITVLLLALALNSFLCVVVIYCAVFANSDAFGLSLIVLSGCCLYAAQILLTSRLIPFLLLLLLAALFSYLSIRLYHSNKLSWQHSLVIASLHLTAVASNIACVSPHLPIQTQTSLPDGLLSVFGFISNHFLFFMLLHIVAFEQQSDLGEIEILQYLVFLIAALVCSTPVFLTDLLRLILGSEPVFSAYLGLGSLIVSCAYLKLTFFNKSLPSRGRFYLVTLIVAPVITLVLQPQLSLESAELQKWSVIVGLSCILIALPLATIHRNSLHIIGSCFGMPLALCCLHLMFPSSPSLLFQLIVGIQVFICLILLLVAWQNPKNSSKWIKALALMIGVTSLALFAVENALDVGQRLYVGVTLASVTSFLVAVVIKVRYSEYEQNQLDGCFGRNRQLSGIAVLGNIHSVASFGFLVIQLRFLDFWYIWVCLFSFILLLLNRDDFLLHDLSTSNRFAPVATATSLTLYVATILDCRLLTATTAWAQCVGVVELLALLLTIPVVLNFWTVCWCGSYWWSDKLVVFLTPVFFLFIFFGQSYASWTLALCGFLVGAWLMKCKLPLEVNR